MTDSFLGEVTRYRTLVPNLQGGHKIPVCTDDLIKFTFILPRHFIKPPKLLTQAWTPYSTTGLP